MAEALFVDTLPDPTLRLLAPIKVRVEPADGLVAVVSSEFDEYGFGSTASDALADFAAGLAETYRGLRDCRATLGPRTQALYERLSAVIVEGDPCGPA